MLMSKYLVLANVDQRPSRKTPYVSCKRAWRNALAKAVLMSHPVLRIKPNAYLHIYMYARIKFHTYRDIISE